MTSLVTFRTPFAVVVCLAVWAAGLTTVSAQEAPMTVSRYAGGSRTETAAIISGLAHPDGADRVLLARADSYGDALAAAPLAAALDAPVLLTAPAALDAFAAAEIDRLDATQVVVLGDIADGVIFELSTVGRDVRRLRGEDAWATYAAIATEVTAETGATRALLVEGAHSDPTRGWPDALTTSAMAASEGVPVLMTMAEELPGPTLEVLSDSGITDVTIVGGTSAVSTSVGDTVNRTIEGDVDRLAGADRYATGVEVARRGLDEMGYTSDVWVASGRSWPDALVAGPAIAKLGGVLVLSDPTDMRHSPTTRNFIETQRGFASRAHLVGGTAALSDLVAQTVQTGELAQTSPTTPVTTPPPPPTVSPADPDRPPAVPADNTAPPITGAVPWSDPDTWGGEVPGAGEEVTIPVDKAVLLDVDPPRLEGLRVEGTLVAADIDMTIEVDWILVTGRLALGTEDAPLTSDVTVILDPQPGADIAGAGEGPIAVQGGTLDIHGTKPTHTWTRLALTAGVGTTSLTLQEPPGWDVGDTIVIASTALGPDEAEERTVTAIDGTAVTLDRPLTYTHWGQADQLAGKSVGQYAEVASLSRNIVVTSTEAAKERERGGHVQVFAGSVAHISGAEFTGLGQAGELARYPVHFHMMGNASGSYVRGAAVHHTFNRCVTFHGSHNVDMTETVGYESLGHCYFFEDGVETGNTLHCNLGLSTRAPSEGLALLESDLTPATYWISNPTNHLTENVAAGSESHGFWFDLPEAPTGMSAGVELDIRSLPLGTFDDNVGHSSKDRGWKDGVGLFVEDYEPVTPAIMRGNSVFNTGFGAWTEGAELHDSTIVGNGVGFLGLDAALVDSLVVGSTTNPASSSSWRSTGVGLYHNRSDITDTTFVNFSDRPHTWQHPGLAMEFFSDEANVPSHVSGAQFVNSNRMEIVDPTGEDGPDMRSALVRDVDGSISGAPAVLASNNPMMFDASCSWREDLRAHACPAEFERVWLRLTDLGGGSLGQTTILRDDGASAPLDGPMWAPGETSGEVLLNRGYEVTSTGNHSGQIEVVVHGTVEGYVDLEIPWPYPTAFGYSGWGRWTDLPLEANLTADGQTVRLRHTFDEFEEYGTWQRIELCATPFCGNPGPG